MTPPHLRVVTAEDAARADSSFADAARAALEWALAQGAVALAVVWESPDKFDIEAVPESNALKRGLLLEGLNRLDEEDE